VIGIPQAFGAWATRCVMIIGQDERVAGDPKASYDAISRSYMRMRQNAAQLYARACTSRHSRRPDDAVREAE
jgi:hypothetical protein